MTVDVSYYIPLKTLEKTSIVDIRILQCGLKRHRKHRHKTWLYKS